MDPLTEQQQTILDLERQWWAMPGNKESAIRDQLGLSAVRYYQLLQRLVWSDTALVYDPVTVNRLRRISMRAPTSALGFRQHHPGHQAAG